MRSKTDGKPTDETRGGGAKVVGATKDLAEFRSAKFTRRSGIVLCLAPHSKGVAPPLLAPQGKGEVPLPLAPQG